MKLIVEVNGIPFEELTSEQRKEFSERLKKKLLSNGWVETPRDNKKKGDSIVYGCNLFAKTKLMPDKLMEAITNAWGVVEESILFVAQSNDWLKRKGESIVIEYNGKLSKEDDEYPDYHYYQLWYDNKMDNTKIDKLNELLGEDVIVDTE